MTDKPTPFITAIERIKHHAAMMAGRQNDDFAEFMMGDVRALIEEIARLSNKPINLCRWCGHLHETVHADGTRVEMPCPTVKALEFFEDGVTVKRVEFRTAQDYVQQYPYVL